MKHGHALQPAERGNCHEKQVYMTSSDENIDATMPMVSVSAKPLTGPLASQKRIAAVRNWVTCASKIALNAFGSRGSRWPHEAISPV